MQTKTRFLFWCLFGLFVFIRPAAAVPTSLDFSAYTPGTDISSVTIPGVTFAPGTGTVTVSGPNSLRIDGVSGSAVDFEIRTDTVMQSSSFFATGYGACQLIDRFEWSLSGTPVDSYQNVLGGSGRCIGLQFDRTFGHDSITFSIDITAGGFGGTVILSDIVLDLPAPAPVPAMPPLGILLLAGLLVLMVYATRSGRFRL